MGLSSLFSFGVRNPKFGSSAPRGGGPPAPPGGPTSPQQPFSWLDVTTYLDGTSTDITSRTEIYFDAYGWWDGHLFTSIWADGIRYTPIPSTPPTSLPGAWSDGPESGYIYYWDEVGAPSSVAADTGAEHIACNIPPRIDSVSLVGSVVSVTGVNLDKLPTGDAASRWKLRCKKTDASFVFVNVATVDSQSPTALQCTLASAPPDPSLVEVYDFSATVDTAQDVAAAIAAGFNMATDGVLVASVFWRP